MKKGFTLVELLAVIVIIGLVALITAPIVLNVISNSAKNTFKSSVEQLVHIVEADYSEYARSGQVTYRLNDNTLTCPVCTEKITFNGKIENGQGTIVNENGRIISLDITNGDYQATINSEGKIVVQ